MRAFVVGNGPSLKPDQLDKLIPEVSFGVNRIHLIYPQTRWRPTHWVIMDFSNSLFYKEDVNLHSREGYPCYLRSDICAKFFEWCVSRFPDVNRTIPHTDNIHILERCNHIDCERHTSDGWHEPLCQMGGSVPTAIQLAVQMGYKTIYTIGMDGNREGNAENNFIAGYIDKDAMGVQAAMIANETGKLALEIAKSECGARGVKLIDATVGGSGYKSLPEVDFYELFD